MHGSLLKQEREEWISKQLYTFNNIFYCLNKLYRKYTESMTEGIYINISFFICTYVQISFERLWEIYISEEIFICCFGWDMPVYRQVSLEYTVTCNSLGTENLPTQRGKRHILSLRYIMVKRRKKKIIKLWALFLYAAFGNTWQQNSFGRPVG